MRDETDFTAIPLQARKDAGATFSWTRVVGIASALALHGVLLLTVLRAPSDLPERPRVRNMLLQETPSGMALVLLDPQVKPSSHAQSMARPTARMPSMTVVFRTPQDPDVSAPARPNSESTPPTTATTELSLSDLSSQTEAIAREMAGPLQERSNQTLPTLPGAAIGVNLHAPVKRWKQITPEQVGNVLARILVATMASNPDDYEKVRDGRDPLQEWTSAHLNSFDEPHCDDPEDPLRDRRCYDDNPNVRR
ncbi:hypothetical protein C7S18_01365 [Ahniella affigens]|uniref:Uncharacterized protein n=1 Tax=Ahniella affigens TaxID=2021234 RepID=A0A2P1PM72_9GAMM|nr:hypothetical protein [Ahniella affigens]AVP95927.1 hypothetical protein C7S18_01365 [Ahniella affigens]